MFLFIFERQSMRHEWGRGRERGRHRIQSRLQALSCQHRAQCRARTHKPQDHDLSRGQMLNRLSNPGTPTSFLKRTFFGLKKSKYIFQFSKCNLHLNILNYLKFCNIEICDSLIGLSFFLNVFTLSRVCLCVNNKI